MKRGYKISITLDKRRETKNGKYPIRLRVYDILRKKQKLFSTIFEMTEKEFGSVWKTEKPRRKHRESKEKLTKLLYSANEIARETEPFTIELFEKKMFMKPGEGVKLKYQYKSQIKYLKSKKRIGSAKAYELSEKSIMKFVNNYQNKNYENITFYDITEKWLEDYEDYMISEKGRSSATVGIYLRALRAVFNQAIKQGELDKKFYPFGNGSKYIIPNSRRVKKTLTKEQLRNFFDAKPLSREQEIAKDFWFFSYACNGMNVKDIVLLKYADVDDNKITYRRAKTKNSTKKKSKPITVYSNDFIQGIINKYGNADKSPDNYIFNILTKELTPEQEYKKIQNFTRFINQHTKKLCKANGLPEISTYWARHSFATNAVNEGYSMELMQESLGHQNIQTTQNYFDGFEDKIKKELAENIMKF
jgi:integrase